MEIENVINKQPEKENRKINFYIPEISALIIIFGLARQLLYYSNFNLPIKYFIGISELGLIIADNIFVQTIIVIVAIFWADTESNKKRLSKNNQRLVISEKNVKIVTYILILIILIVLGYFIVTGKHFYNQIFLIAIFVYLVLLSIVVDDNSRLKNYLVTNKLFLPFLIVLGFSVNLIGSISTELESVEKGKYFGTKITMNDSTKYTSNRNSYFIGKTEKYVFIYNAGDTTTTILNADDIKIIDLKISKQK